jgi:citrate lyase beta subunit
MKTMTDLVEGIQDEALNESIRKSFDQIRRPEELYYAFQAAVSACREASEDILDGKDQDFRKFVFGYQVEIIVDAFDKRMREIAQ